MTIDRRILRPRIVPLLSVFLAALSACAVIGDRGGLSRQPFDDVPVPESFMPFSNDWATIRSPGVVAARLVYMTELGLEAAAGQLTASLEGAGWVRGAVEPIERAGYTGRALSFGKGQDTCRAEVMPSGRTTRVDLMIGRVVP